MTVKEAYNYSVQFLRGNNVDESEFKALCVVCHLVNIKNSQYVQLVNDDVMMGPLAKMLWKLKTGVPLQYVIGKWDFYESEFYVGEGVLIPRPETEELVDKAIKHIKMLGDCLVYDLCAGSGCIGVSIANACKNATVMLFEKSEEAFPYLEKNCNGVDNATPILHDINDAEDFDLADVIVSNPPYIKSNEMKQLQKEVLMEPTIALDGGEDGLDFYRIIVEKWYSKLKCGGVLFLEIGNDQGETILDVLKPFKNVAVYKDMYGNDRMVVAKKE